MRDQYQSVIDELINQRELEENFEEIIDDLKNSKSLYLESWKKYKVCDLFAWADDKLLNNFDAAKVFKEYEVRTYKNREGNIKKDSSGIYVFWVDSKPAYIGRSHRLMRRIKDHVSCSNRNTSSFGHGISKLIYKHDNPKQRIPKDILKTDKRCRDIVRNYIKSLEVSFYYVSPQQEERLYLLELYLSMRYRTVMNRFKPH